MESYLRHALAAQFGYLPGLIWIVWIVIGVCLAGAVQDFLVLAGLGKVVVKALGGEQVKFPTGTRLVMLVAMAIYGFVAWVLPVWVLLGGKERYLWVTVLPMLFVMSTTSTAAVDLLEGKISMKLNLQMPSNGKSNISCVVR